MAVGILKKGKTRDDWSNLLAQRITLFLEFFKNIERAESLPKLGDTKCMCFAHSEFSTLDPMVRPETIVVGGTDLSAETQGLFWPLFGREITRLPQNNGPINEYQRLDVLGLTIKGEWIVAHILYYDHLGIDIPVEVQIYRLDLGDMQKYKETPKGLWHTLGLQIKNLVSDGVIELKPLAQTITQEMALAKTSETATAQ